MSASPDFPKELLARSTWLRELVRALLRDEGAVDDVVQETWLAALASRPARIAKLPAWLRAVARRRAVRWRRGETRRRGREERAARSEVLPSTAEIASRIELQRNLARLVLGLPGSYREVVLLRFWEDLPPRAIAGRLEIPVNTVKTRLRRALDLVRESLDAEAGERETWRRQLLPLAALGSGAVLGVKAALALLAALVGVAAGGLWLVQRAEPGERAALGGAAAVRDAVVAEGASGGGEDGIPVRLVRGEVREERVDSPAAEAPGRPPRHMIQVVDGEGRPVAGVPVALVDRDDRRDLYFSRWKGTTEEPQGYASYADYLEDWETWTAGELHATLEFPLVDPPMVAIRRDSLPENPVQLRLPDTAGLEVCFQHRDGRIARDEVEAYLWAVSPRMLAEDPECWKERRAFPLKASQGWAQLPFIGLGMRLRIQARLADDSTEELELEFAGPSVAGESLQIVFLLGEWTPVFVGRVLGSDGRPLREISIEVFLDTERVYTCHYLSTDEHGRFRCVAGLALDAGVRARFWIGGTEQFAGALSAAAELTGPVPTGHEIDLGDFLLESSPLLMAGRVVDSEGQPVRAHIFHGWPESPERRSSFDLTRTDEEGHFQLCGERVGDVIRLRAEDWSQDHADSEWLDVHLDEAQAAKLRITLERGGDLCGEIRVDEDALSCLCHVVAREQFSKSSAIDRAGRFAFRNLRPGCYEVQIFGGLESALEHPSGAMPERLPLHVIPEVQVGVGENRDPRLEVIDLRESLRLFRGRLFDEYQQPIRREVFELAVEAPGAQPMRYRTHTDREGRFQFLCWIEHRAFRLRCGSREPLHCNWSPEEQAFLLSAPQENGGKGR